jgi:hypothetical protein
MQHDFILLIMNCTKYRYKAEKQKETWLKEINILYFHVLGNDSLESEFLFDESANVLWVKTPDDYNSLPKKVISAYHATMQSYRPSYIFKTDDDQNLLAEDSTKFMNLIYNIIKGKTPKIHYAGNIVNVPEAYLSKYHTIHPELPEYLPVYSTKYCSGRFYILSFEAIYDLVRKREQISKEYLEDYAIGYWLNPVFKTDMFQLPTNKYFQDFANLSV